VFQNVCCSITTCTCKQVQLNEPAAADRRGIGFGWLQNAWLLPARLKIHRGGTGSPPRWLVQKTRGRFTEWSGEMSF
jgi:hypothetical protein